MQKQMQKHYNLKEDSMLPYIKCLGTFSDGLQMMHVWTVDASYVRVTYPNGIEFTMGGHHEKYPFIPTNEIWLDSALPIVELEYTLFDHELPEHYRMRFKHMSYSNAHELSNIKELSMRRLGRPSAYFK